MMHCPRMKDSHSKTRADTGDELHTSKHIDDLKLGTPSFLAFLMKEAEEEQDAIDRLIAAHSAGERERTLKILDELVRRQGLPSPPKPDASENCVIE